MRYIRSYAQESAFPFEDEYYHSQCSGAYKRHTPVLPLFVKKQQPKPNNLPIPPKRIDDNKFISSDNLSILYVVLAHIHPKFTMKLINALDEKQHTFVIHVDIKSQDSYIELLEFAKDRNNIFLVDKDNRISLTWGGFSIVNATLISLKYGFEKGRHFDWFINLSGTTYPIQHKSEIKKALSGNPNSIYMDVHDEPNKPPPELWHHYVECDDKLHRIARLPPLRGMNMHVGSQWFIVPRHFAQWILEDPLPIQYKNYAQHVVVADENYFATLFKNSPYCEDLVKNNFLFSLFDKWENKKQTRDYSKCLNPDVNHCGRSPTTLDMQYSTLVEVSSSLFARKFDPSNPNRLVIN
jgi:hypothetical protein